MSKENRSRYALLGMLNLAPMSGYDLKKHIEQSVGHFWHENYPQIYPILKQLEKEGLATSTVEKQAGRPDRHIYSITEQGRQELCQWLTEPFDYQIQRNELLLKLFFGNLLPASASMKQVQRYREHLEEQLLVYTEIENWLRTAQAGHPQLPYWLMTVSYGKHDATAMLSWCNESLSTLEQLASAAQPDARTEQTN